MPKRAKDPANPAKSRHVTTFADNGSPNAVALMEHDVQNVLAWLNSAPLRTITGEGMRAWCAEQKPPWTSGYRQRVLDRVGEVMREQTEADAQTVRARLLSMTDKLLPECINVMPVGGELVHDPRTADYKAWRKLYAVACEWEKYDRLLRDWNKELRISQTRGYGEVGPEPSEPLAPRLTEAQAILMGQLFDRMPYLHEIDHTAAQGYIKIVGQLTGVMSEKQEHKHLHLHRAMQSGDFSEVPTDILEAEAAKLGSVRGRPG